ncbi:MAG: hypothetical protein UV74_C0002G0002 [Candidatus Woesebacteria bacterium GW2011_GWB1_43_14]|uniref:Uncharacterized protein n=1 Tax=Candidatus Woesebacteria bacterium GW2011_GWB1_43_14 TaxID=1618578 RepID=A0A0G1GJ39_9BACT|nr:MAG: hypothetical protein UV51_C0004G0049 [Candidatus Woesebacteria bacterium GW2011_GWC1_42_9]KKS98783.1 MAG: hypothetical protein UV74_C0002G0002 [Candidatus Woesebacteria bacterium GW2011_GWB1_43_14]
MLPQPFSPLIKLSRLKPIAAQLHISIHNIPVITLITRLNVRTSHLVVQVPQVLIMHLVIGILASAHGVLG